MELSRRVAALEVAAILLVLLVLCVHVADGQGTPKTKTAAEATYTPKEKAALQKFKKSLTDIQTELTQPYMRREEYLINWLRARDLDVGRAKAMLLKNLRWRKAENIDELPAEKISAFEREFPYDIQSVDKEGRPVIMYNLGKWNFRKAALAGQLQKVHRYFNKVVYEVPALKAYEAGQATGSNSTHFLLIADLSGFNMRQHACALCLPFYLWIVETYENYYPQMMKETIIINTPQIFDVIINLTKPFWSKQFTEHFLVLGHDKNEFRQKLGEFIALDQLPVQFGGTDPRRV